MLNVNEIFDSIQGEGSYMGIPATFIRLAGCPVRCSFCDTKSSWDKGEIRSVEDILNECHYETVVITGGEPLLQLRHLLPLVQLLHDEGYKVHLETSGMYDIPKGVFDFVCCSPKAAIGYHVPEGPINEMKLVVTDDFKMPENVLAAGVPIWLQPCSGRNYDKIIALVQQYSTQCRAGVQLHLVYGVQ